LFVDLLGVILVIGGLIGVKAMALTNEQEVVPYSSPQQQQTMMGSESTSQVQQLLSGPISMQMKRDMTNQPSVAASPMISQPMSQHQTSIPQQPSIAASPMMSQPMAQHQVPIPQQQQQQIKMIEESRPEMRREMMNQQGSQTVMMMPPSQQIQQSSLPQQQQQIWTESRPEIRREMVQPVANNPTVLQQSQQLLTQQQQGMTLNNLNINQQPASPAAVILPKPSLHQMLVTKEVSSKVGSIIGNIIPSIIEWIVSD
jgi:hypothetical protein